jgi:hypothetical protein
MNYAIFTFGSFSKEYGGQCRILKQGFNKNNNKIIELEAKEQGSFAKIFFYLLGLRSGLMFTGFSYKLNLPKNLITSDFIISFSQVITWNLFFYLIKNKKKIIYWNDMPIEKIADIYVKGFFWKKVVVYIAKIQYFFLDYQIIGTNKRQFRIYKNIPIVPRIVDDCFYRTRNKKYSSDTWTMVLIGNDFFRKKFQNIITFANKLFKKINVDLKIYVIGKSSILEQNKINENVFFLGQLSKNKISVILNKLNNFFTISISKDEGAPISLLEIQAAGGFSLCTKYNGGASYVPANFVFENKKKLTKILLKLILNKKFRNYMRYKNLKHMKNYTSISIARRFFILS